MLKEKITSDIKEAMKSGNAGKLGVLRMLNASVKNEEIKKGKEAVLTDEEVLQVLAREAKKRRESIVAFEKGGRPELAEKEKAELLFIEQYLPKQMPREEVTVVVEKIIVTLRQAQAFGSEAQARRGDVVFNNVMKAVMQELKGKADGKMINEIVKEKMK